jgi:hypothetical protein
MKRLLGRVSNLIVLCGLAGWMMAAEATPARSDGPMVPAPKLPPPSYIISSVDGVLLYPDGTIVYSDGTYVAPDGTKGLL